MVHGTFEITIDGSLIICKIIGAFNAEGAKRYVEAVKKQITARQSKPFKMLIDHLHFEGATPEAYEIANAYNEWLSTTNIVAKAVVSHSEVINQIELIYTPSKTTQNIQYFQTYEPAMSWLESQ